MDAVIFDFDGIIVDTERLHFEAFNRVLKPMELGFNWDDYIRHYIGFDDRDAFRTRLANGGRTVTSEELAGLLKQKAATFHRMVSEETPIPFPGSVELIRELSGKLPLALCSGALRSDIEPVFKGLGLHGLFDVLVTADDVAASKPDPSCYRLAVARLSEHHQRALDPARCLAIEDTPAGIKAAKGAGLKVLALPNSHHQDLLGLADVVRESLVGFRLAEFGA